MTAIKKLINGSGNQYFPETHTKAVVDDYGNSVESVLDTQNDLINQAQMAVGAVPSDIYPTEGSTNWVTSGGVHSAITDLSGKLLGYRLELTWVQGAISSSDGSESDSTTRLRSSLASVDYDTLIKVADGYKIYIHWYQDGIWTGSVGAWQTGNVTVQGGEEFKIVLAKSNDSTITVDEASNLFIYVGTVRDWIKDVSDAAGYYVSNPEWLRVITDNEGKILAGIKADGSVVWSVGVPEPIKSYFSQNLPMNYGESQEFLSVVLDSEDKILYGVRKDGSFFWSSGVPKQVQDYVKNYVEENTLPASDDILMGDKSILEQLSNERVYQFDSTGREIPNSEAALNVYKKAKQMVELPWTALRTVPRNDGNVWSVGAHTQLPYSSVKEIDKYVGYDVSLLTFMTALHNPYSLIYTENVSAAHSASAYGKTYHGLNCGTYYGQVCSVFVSFALGLRMHFDTDQIAYYASIGKFTKLANQTANGVRFGDVVWIPGHCRIVTDVYHDNRGNVERLEISEELGSARSTWYTASEFNIYMKTLASGELPILYRSNELYKNVSYKPYPEFVTVENEVAETYVYNDDICTFAGDYPTFCEGEDIFLNYRVGNYDRIEIYKNDTLLETLIISENSDIIILMGQDSNNVNIYAINLSGKGYTYGKYKARLSDGTNSSEYTYWEILDISSSVSRTGDKFTIEFNSTNGTPVYLDCSSLNGTRYVTYEFTEDDIANGYVVLKLKELASVQNNETLSGNYYIKTHVEGDYGRARNMINVTI